MANIFVKRFYQLCTVRTGSTINCAHYSNALANVKEKPVGANNKLNKRLILKLEELFNIRTYLALDVATNHSKLNAVSLKTLSKNFDVCKQYKLSKSVILDNIDVLSESQLSSKLELIRDLPFPISKTIVLANLHHEKLLRLLPKLKPNEETGPGGRIQVLADILQTTPEFICTELVKKLFLSTKDISIIKNDVELMTSYGIDLEEIKRDLWVLRYSTAHLKERLKFAKDNNVEHIKTWMMRATSDIFNTYLRRRSDNKSVLGDSSLIEYLSKKLECSTEFAKCILVRQPALKNKSMKKMREIIDFLLSQGFETMHICRVPKILLHSVETSKKRLKELDDQGVHMKSVHILTKSQRQYRQYYESLLKINQMKLKKTSNEAGDNANSKKSEGESSSGKNVS